jgi:hypothetical protein
MEGNVCVEMRCGGGRRAPSLNRRVPVARSCSRAPPPHRPREDELAHPADTILAHLRLGSSRTLTLGLEQVSTGVVHLVASIDHVNAPLLWDKKAATRLNWCALQ